MLEEMGIGITTDFHDGTIYEEGYGLHCHKIIATDPEIPVTALGVYYYLNSYLYGGKLEAFPTQLIMAYHLGITDKTLREYIHILEREGYIVVEKIQGKYKDKTGRKNHKQNLYHIISSIDDIIDLKARGDVARDEYIERLNEKKRKREARSRIKRRQIKSIG